MRYWGRRGLRTRLTLIGVSGLAVGLAVGLLGLLAALRFGLLHSMDSEIIATAEGVAQMIDEQTLPDPVPVAGSQNVQVIDESGRVRSASAGADRLVPVLPMAKLAAVRDGARIFVDGHRAGVSGRLRVAGVPAGPEGRLTVLVARPVAELAQSVDILRDVLLIAFPLMVLGPAVVMWQTVGATLRPVEALRRGAEEITGGTRAADRLPLPAARDEIHRLAVTLNDMLTRLDAAQARQRAFVADAAHELRSPLASMRVQLEVAQRLADQTDWPALAGDLLADNERLSRLVDDLLLLARSDEEGTGPRPGRAEPVELGGLIETVAQGFPGAPLRLVQPERPLWVMGEPDALHRVVANLVDNALRYARTSVVLSADGAGRDQQIIVTDDGPGIPPADRDRAFDRFARLDTARSRPAGARQSTGGTGLGLAIVRQLVRRHGGSVLLADARPWPWARAGGAEQPWPGLRVEVRLPAVVPPEPEPEPEPEPGLGLEPEPDPAPER